MEFHGWQQCQRKETDTGTLALLPPSWDTLSAIYTEIVRFVSKFPCQKRLVLYFAYRGTTVKLDLGDVKAAGAVCILGLGVGLGTLFIYRLYCQYIKPFLHRSNSDKTDSETHESGISLDSSSDSAVDGTMGNKSSNKATTVYYSPEYGVALGGKGLSPNQQNQRTADGVRLRRTGTRQRPIRRFVNERDAICCGKESTELNLSVCSEPSIRDSFYSTAESGFETLPECNEEDEDNPTVDGLQKESFSLSKHDGCFPSLHDDHSDSPAIGDKNCFTVPLLGNVNESNIHPLPIISSAKSSPLHLANRVPDPSFMLAKRRYSYTDENSCDLSLDASESVCSFNSSADEWSWEEEERSGMSVPSLPSVMSDAQFKRSLMQRIHEWSTFAEEYGRSRSPTPDCSLNVVRRSRSLDRHIGEPVYHPDLVDLSASEPIKVEDTTTKNLECLESELQDIQGEFESITCRLHELIERGNKTNSDSSDVQCSTSEHRHSHTRTSQFVYHRGRTKWECMPKMSRSESGRSSRASSVEFSWDCGEVDHHDDKLAGDEEPINAIVNVGDPLEIVDYAHHEWKGQTEKAEKIKKGYMAVPEILRCSGLRTIRGDNYCALRSTLYQILVSGFHVTHHWPGLISIVDRLHSMQSNSSVGLQYWTFGNRLKWCTEEDRFSTICKCVLSLYTTIEEVSNIQNPEEREAKVLSLLNTSEKFDIELMEGLKLMMLFHAIDLKQEIEDGASEIPTFAWLLFARHTSQTIVDFVKNHLNSVGDSAGLDQVEMCLLGHTLGVRLLVTRLDHFGQEDFQSSFPDDVPLEWPQVYLLSEDDRHYNVPIP